MKYKTVVSFLDFLHESVVGKFVSDKRDECCLQYVAEEISIHDAIKDANLSGTMSTNSPPDVNFEWVLRFRLSFCRLVRHPEACTAIRLKGNRALIAKNNVVESVSTLQDALCELQPLHFVSVTNQLAIGSPLQSPAGHTHAVGVQSRYKICNAKLGPVVFEPKMAGVCWKRKWKVLLMCIYMILTKTLNMPLF